MFYQNFTDGNFSHFKFTISFLEFYSFWDFVFLLNHSPRFKPWAIIDIHLFQIPPISSFAPETHADSSERKYNTADATS